MPVTAARLIAHGQPLEVGPAPLDEPGDDEVVVDMVYGGVNPVDRYGALGRVAPDGPLPRTLGGEGVGELDGRCYIVHGAGLGSRRDGLWATQAVVPRDALLAIPDGVDAPQAAAMAVAGVTAWRTTVEIGQVTAEDRVLVLGASGGVGSIIVSIAHGRGATVWAQTGSSEKETWVGALGADRVVVTEADGLVDAVTDLEPTIVLDPLGGAFFGAAVTALAARGRLVSYGTSAGTDGQVPIQALYRKGVRVTGYAGLIESAADLRRGMEAALAAVAAGVMVVPIDEVLPLAEVNEAFRRIVDRQVRGKLLLDCRAP